jgi:ribosomal protein S13
MDFTDNKYANVVTDIIGVGTQVAQTIANVSDIKKRREFEQAFELLDNRQKQALENSLAKTNDSNKKLELLFNAVTTLKSAQRVASILARVVRVANTGFKISWPFVSATADTNFPL